MGTWGRPAARSSPGNHFSIEKSRLEFPAQPTGDGAVHAAGAGHVAAEPAEHAISSRAIAHPCCAVTHEHSGAAVLPVPGRLRRLGGNALRTHRAARTIQAGALIGSLDCPRVTPARFYRSRQ